MSIEEIDKWLKEEEGISYTELGNEFNYAVEKYNKYAKEMKRLKNIINELENYLSNLRWFEMFSKDIDTTLYASTKCFYRDIKEILKGSDKE